MSFMNKGYNKVLPQFFVDDVDKGCYEHIAKCYAAIEEGAKLFLADKQGAVVSDQNKEATYLNAPDYFAETMRYHHDPWVHAFMSTAMRVTMGNDKHRLVDTGCAFGVTGLCWAMAGEHVIFHDFAGSLGLQFIEDFARRCDITEFVEIIPYGEPIKRQDAVLSFDVTEHVPNSVGYLQYLKELGDLVLVTWPCRVPRKPPYEIEGLDQWIDDEAMIWIIERRYQMFWSQRIMEWRSVIYA